MKRPEGDKERLEHISECCDNILASCKGVGIDEFMNNLVLRTACAKWLEIIGEASNHITDDFRTTNSHIEWSKIIGMRNILVHEYFGIDYPAIWNVILLKVEELKIEVDKLLDGLIKNGE